MQKPNRKRSEWVNIIKDKEDNNLTVDQVAAMYNVTVASIMKWQGIFKKEKLNAPITEIDVIELIKRSIADFDNNVKRIDEQSKNLAAAKADILAKKDKLQASLKALTGVKASS